jgi:predicted DNA-binding protein
MKETKEEGTVATSVRLPAGLREQLEAVATVERRTLGNVIRIALEDWLISRGKK